MQDSIVAQAAEAIREYVISQRLAPGQRLPSERDLAASLGTSRPALREAIRRLESERVIDIRGRSGIYIASLDVDEVFAVRLRLEPFAAQLTAERRTDAQLSELQAMLTALSGVQQDPVRFSAADRRLHAAVATFSGNGVLSEFILQLNDLTLISRGTTAQDDQTRSGTFADMVNLISAIRLRDGGAAATAMRIHLERISATAAAEPFASHLSQRLRLRR